ncbi:MAG: hypothetical protein CM15mV10_2140 [uncultured marine virus]|nr:MAG: hypothetical protein CM15mV10_2140 [uncultured marine virus]
MPKLTHTLKVTNPNTKVESEVTLEGLASFSDSLLHNTLRQYYDTNFALIHHHKWHIEHIENLMPWEKEIYVTMLIDFLREGRETNEGSTSSSNKQVAKNRPLQIS